MGVPPVDNWTDPIAAADAAATSLLRRLDEEHQLPPALAALRRRNNEALILVLADEATGDNARAKIEQFRESLRDWSWLHRMAVEHAGASHLGIVSLGLLTRRFLEAVADVSTAVPEVRTHSRAVARGIGYLGLPTSLGEPAEAGTLLVPAVARHGDRVWTTPRAAHSMRARPQNIVVLCHPAAALSARTRVAYRPDPIVMDVKLTTGVSA